MPSKARPGMRHRKTVNPQVMRRRLTVTISALLTVAVFVGYCAADVADIAPGLLTLKPVNTTMFAAPLNAKSGGVIATQLDRSKAIDAGRAADLMNELLAAQGVGQDTSVIIQDAQGLTAAEHEADTPREPASTMKTLTALAASTKLNMASTLDTQTFITSSNNATTVTLKGNGDMLLSAGQSDPTHINGRAGLATLAQATAAALTQRGINTITLNYDDTLFGDTRIPQGLRDGDAVNGDYTMYYTPVSSMAIDGGRQYTAATPAPSNPDDSSGYPELSQHTAQNVAEAFAQLLTDNGITVEGAPVAAEAPKSVSPVASVSSATLQEILAFTLRHSDNTLAEEFGRLTALATSGAANSPEGGTQAVREQLESLGIDTSGLTMADCSGLSPGSQLTVRTLAAVQQHNLGAGSGTAAAEGLSIAGLIGTAANRYTDDEVAGLLRVKTGSLGTVTSMTGNISRIHGGALVFAVVVNNPSDIEAARNAINVFITKLARL
ncbi:D-alanyl-D-alanine carboxypeptidase/D-alanyl-D-alanine-endopeptidase [Bifidobacterium sp. LC6]|uniref:D-alanyl-D-alanine carboxypeptidase/D-alanyl-D-alanine-endopeptidase n=1 Tax=Bifidobacterium colobi TaxID=2809026 RepID=A0ABS5UXU0_9BIFI|nr:D-alanyl-D-alanine carboxypeptidase/D-alanyl-D-alanine-endopeptidase [Bifidobacterium colobi]MBT1175108.1 D-alanyl-D-alanine carboxypeptidase/D-alanyl-D-alanine-endopeptidase [Bifidobacterium colobi]